MKIVKIINSSKVQSGFRLLLAFFMIYAGISHLTFGRVEFQAQVPEWVPFSKDFVVVTSGVIEIILGLGLGFWKKQRIRFGWALAIFFILIFPGNISQYLEGTNAFGILDSDGARLRRLLFQPVLVIWALWCSGAWKDWKSIKSNTNE